MGLRRHVLSYFGSACLLLFLNGLVFADCVVLNPEEMDRFAGEAASNQSAKGFYLGCSVVVFAINAFICVRQRRFIFLAVFSLIAILIQPIFIFGELMAYCGHRGADANYYAYEFLALLAVFLGLILMRDWRWKSRVLTLSDYDA